MKHGSAGEFSQSLILSSDVLPSSIQARCQDFRKRGDLIVRDRDFSEFYLVYGSNGNVRGSILLSAIEGKALVIDGF